VNKPCPQKCLSRTGDVAQPGKTAGREFVFRGLFIFRGAQEGFAVRRFNPVASLPCMRKSPMPFPTSLGHPFFPVLAEALLRTENIIHLKLIQYNSKKTKLPDTSRATLPTPDAIFKCRLHTAGSSSTDPAGTETAGCNFFRRFNLVALITCMRKSPMPFPTSLGLPFFPVLAEALLRTGEE
jgi:hypothetical protein